LNPETAKLLQKLDEIGEVSLVKKFDDPKEAFAYYFSILDINGIDRLLNDYHNYDGESKDFYLSLIRNEFENFKKENIHFLKPLKGICKGCKNCCSGYVFVDEKSGFYVNMVITVKNSEIVDLIECLNFKLEVENSLLKEQIIIKPFLQNIENQYDIPF
jgi:hypothetical protein